MSTTILSPGFMHAVASPCSIDSHHQKVDVLTSVAETISTRSKRSDYLWLRQEITKAAALDDGSSSWVCYLQVPEKMRFFVWLSLLGCLPTDATCSLCDHFEDLDLDHCFRCCSWSEQVWNLTDFPYNPSFYSMDFRSWLTSLAKSEHGTLFIIVLWTIWMARNNSEPYFVEEVLHQATLAFDDISRARTSVASNCAHVLVQWIAHSVSSFKLNVDGSSFGNPGRAGFGGVVRNHLGEWVFGFSGSIGRFISLHAELVGIQQGLKLVWEFGIRKLICHSDSKLALDLVDKKGFSRHQEVVTSIQDLVDNDWSVSLEHTFREGNQCADFMAKQGASGDVELSIWMHPLAYLAFSLLADASGFPFLRS